MVLLEACPLFCNCAGRRAAQPRRQAYMGSRVLTETAAGGGWTHLFRLFVCKPGEGARTEGGAMLCDARRRGSRSRCRRSSSSSSGSSGRSSGGAAREDKLDRPASSGAIADAGGQFRKIVVPAKGGGQVWDAGVRD